MKLYFAHSIKDYNTEYEEKCIKKIKELYPNYEIINPKDIILEETDRKKLSGTYAYFIQMMIKHYFSAIKKCDLLIAVTQNDNKKLTQGVFKEIKFALSNNIKVRNLDDIR